MTATGQRLHLQVSGETRGELGRARGALLRESLPRAYAQYEELFRVCGVMPDAQRQGAKAAIEAIAEWRPDFVDELTGVAEETDLELVEVAALNARTELLSLGARGAPECSTVVAEVAGRRMGAQTWDWHLELDPYWHTQEVDGPGYRHVGLTEQGIVGKIGVNEAGLALHLNILGHRDDRPGGVPVHILATAVLSECANVTEAVELIRNAPMASSSAFTLVDASRSVSLETSPVGVFAVPESDGTVQRTNHFRSTVPLGGQKTDLVEPNSSARLDLLRQRLTEGLPENEQELVSLLATGEGEPPLTCVPDMLKPFGDRIASLATIVTDPGARRVSILDGAPVQAREEDWRTLIA